MGHNIAAFQVTLNVPAKEVKLGFEDLSEHIFGLLTLLGFL